MTVPLFYFMEVLVMDDIQKKLSKKVLPVANEDERTELSKIVWFLEPFHEKKFEVTEDTTYMDLYSVKVMLDDASEAIEGILKKADIPDGMLKSK